MPFTVVILPRPFHVKSAMKHCCNAEQLCIWIKAERLGWFRKPLEGLDRKGMWRMLIVRVARSWGCRILSLAPFACCVVVVLKVGGLRTRSGMHTFIS